MAFETIDVIRYIFYVFDFIFGVLSWGITANKLNVTSFGGACLLTKIEVNAGVVTGNRNVPVCNAIIALGVITMIALLAIVVLRTLDILDQMSFPEIIEIISFGVMALIWLCLAIVTVATTDNNTREISEVRTAIAGAWLAFFTHVGSSITSLFARRQK